MANVSEDGKILMKGTRVWAHYSKSEYYHGRIRNIQGTTITVDFDDGYVMEYRNGHLTGEVVIAKKVDVEDLKEGLVVIAKMPRKQNGDIPMYKGVIQTVVTGKQGRRIFVVQILKEHGERVVRKCPSSLMIVETDYQIKESEPEDSNLLQWSTPGAETPTQVLLNATIPVMEQLPKPLSPEILWGNQDLIALHTIVKNCESWVFNEASPQEQGNTNELTLGARFDPLRQPDSACNYPPIGTSTPFKMFNSSTVDHVNYLPPAALSSIYPSLSTLQHAPNKE